LTITGQAGTYPTDHGVTIATNALSVSSGENMSGPSALT